jgi:hypothetical protein
MSMSMRPTRPGRPWPRGPGRGAGEVDREGAFADAALAGGDRHRVRTPFEAPGLAPAWPAGGGGRLGRLDGELDDVALVTPGSARRLFSTSSLSCFGTFGSLVEMASAKPARRRPSKLADLTRPKETMSRLNPGYFTFLSCPMMSSVVTFK